MIENNAKEIVRQIYEHTDPELAVEWVAEIGRDFADAEMPFEVRRLGRTITPVGGSDLCVASLPRHERADRSRQQLGETDQACRVRARELSTSPSPLPALRRQTRLGPATHDPTLKRGEPLKWQNFTILYTFRIVALHNAPVANVKGQFDLPVGGQ